MIPLAAAAVLFVAAAVTFWAAYRMRQRRLRPTQVVMIDGAPHVLYAVQTNLDEVPSWAFEPLGEMLARVVMPAPPLTLFEVLAKAGWKPPPPDGRQIGV